MELINKNNIESILIDYDNLLVKLKHVYQRQNVTMSYKSYKDMSNITLNFDSQENLNNFIKDLNSTDRFIKIN